MVEWVMLWPADNIFKLVIYIIHTSNNQDDANVKHANWLAVISKTVHNLNMNLQYN